MHRETSAVIAELRRLPTAPTRAGLAAAGAPIINTADLADRQREIAELAQRWMDSTDLDDERRVTVEAIRDDSNRQVSLLGDETHFALTTGDVVRWDGTASVVVGQWNSRDAVTVKSGDWSRHHLQRVSDRATIHPTAIVHPTARIEPGAVIDAHARVGPYAHVGEGSVIARRVIVGDGAFLGMNTTTEDGATVGAGAVVGAHSHIGRHAYVGAASNIEASTNIDTDTRVAAGSEQRTPSTPSQPWRSQQLASAVNHALQLDRDQAS